MIRVCTGSRLHFGLFSLPLLELSGWKTHEAAEWLSRRQFGGIGMMIEEPRIDLTVESSKSWSSKGRHPERAIQFAQAYCKHAGVKAAFRLHIESAAPEHMGLGTGTQVGLAIARAIAELTDQPNRDAVALAHCVKRGLRSAIGVHGFEQGGLIVEGGKETGNLISPLVVRHAVPDEWRIVLITPCDLIGIHGAFEIKAFARMEHEQRDQRATETLCRIVLLNLLPALIERDLEAFGDAVYDFNRRVGEMFQAAQGGIYANARIGEIIKIIRELGVWGVGQSSWGPTIFAFVEADQAAHLCDRLIANGAIATDEILITSPRNRGAEIFDRA
jgi:beta-ribofuranosylaminobenzene 5'-phosphate synthase